MELRKLRKLTEADGGITAASELVALCFAARTAMHIAHLRSTNYAEHIALGDFYDAIAGLADGFIECHMGITGQMASIPAMMPDQSTPPLTYLGTLRAWVASNRSSASEGNTELENTIDEILTLIDRTCYKLKFLH
jgi:hypothetical protein